MACDVRPHTRTVNSFSIGSGNVCSEYSKQMESTSINLQINQNEEKHSPSRMLFNERKENDQIFLKLFSLLKETYDWDILKIMQLFAVGAFCFGEQA